MTSVDDSVTRHVHVANAAGLEEVVTTAVEDLSFPLTHYWIVSSHNTYLTEDQIKGPASTCTYMLFLKRYRGGCVEIDPGKVSARQLPDGTTLQDVTVTHVGTPTGTIWLSDLLSEMRQWVDSVRHTDEVVGPIILSFDNKKIKNATDQGVIWQLLDKYINISPTGRSCAVAGEECKWYLDPKSVDVSNHANLTPQALKGKFIVKWAECARVDRAGVCSDPAAGKGLIPRHIVDAATLPPERQPDLSNAPPSTERFVHMPKSKTCDLHSKACHDASIFWQVRSTHHEYKYSNINMAIVDNAKHNFIRVFPNPLEFAKIKSGNYPQTGSWLHGAQMVSINIQKQDRYWQVNDTMFSHSPCRLKPLWMRTDVKTPPMRQTLALKRLQEDGAAQLHFFHPSGETKMGEMMVNNHLVFRNVYPDACIMYVESTDGFEGAVEIPPNRHTLSGIVNLKLTLWNRPKTTGIKYMGPNCAFSSLREMVVPLRFMWSTAA